ncbi:2,3-bisphosphoglycerate-independent phosphoglycerate mutase-like [Paramacrobiotus metropolitanus]|uniref:2,3-bisphosphoglycerate-independent phosphoglycerate mutase-like n=1 Tax=Paramacrobiotus metropolitanus TaxID=2943436 RepID=UPI002445CBE3|nr:2,3-bisphosphoglycerate-independent phosphoglycerate mutase-like [Paramacrobiotus metropolitanus]
MKTSCPCLPQMASKTKDSKVCLIIIDGWGLSDEKNGNAVASAHTPVLTELSKDKERYTTLEASGLAVGLPRGLMGNSEVGHLNIGAGRIVFQDIVRISLDVENHKIERNLEFVKACERAKLAGGRIHFVGLVSDGGVHSHMDHLFALLDAAKINNVQKAFVHCITDGRDTSPTSSVSYLTALSAKMNDAAYGEIATAVGRYYAMDRDKRWDRIKVAFNALYKGEGEVVNDVNGMLELISRHHSAAETERLLDEFLTPIVIRGDNRIKDGDTVIFFNFRSDRMRQIVETFGLERNFPTDVHPRDLYIACMTQYNSDWRFPLLYTPVKVQCTLPDWISSKNLWQFHCAETEKYAHVTFFFNGGKEKQVMREDRVLVESPKVATYDMQPEMSCFGVADKVIDALVSGKYAFVMCNLAPPDMVGHTGNYEATVKAVEATDCAIGKIFEACKKSGYVLVITADHGNAEQMVEKNNEPHTAHTTNKVPFILCNTKRKFRQIKHSAALCDIAPTILDLMCLEKPAEMGGQSLLESGKG